MNCIAQRSKPVERYRNKTNRGRKLTETECHACDLLYDVTRQSGLTLTEIGEKLGISGSAVSQIINRKFAPSLRTIEKIAGLLGYRLEIRLISRADENVAVNLKEQTQ